MTKPTSVIKPRALSRGGENLRFLRQTLPLDLLAKPARLVIPRSLPTRDPNLCIAVVHRWQTAERRRSIAAGDAQPSEMLQRLTKFRWDSLAAQILGPSAALEGRRGRPSYWIQINYYVKWDGMKPGI